MVSNASTERPGSRFRPRKISELLADELRGQILRGELQPGAALPQEARLMEQFGVSRLAIREAVRVLESESLLSVRRGSKGGALVMAPDHTASARHIGFLLQYQGATLREIHEARMIIEPAAAGILSSSHSDDDLNRLRELLAAEDAARDTNSGEYSRISAQFHTTVVELCKNTAITLLSNVLSEVVEAHSRVVDSSAVDLSRQERLTLSHLSHAKLVRLIEQVDAPAAERHWREHLGVIYNDYYAQHSNQKIQDLITPIQE